MRSYKRKTKYNNAKTYHTTVSCRRILHDIIDDMWGPGGAQ